MTRTQQTFARRWRQLLLPCALVALTGAIILIWARIDRADSRADDLAANLQSASQEADLRGGAVSTLAGDVQALRAQVQSLGRTPVAPDPSEAVQHLPERAQVPVPIPGPQGVPGSQGPSGPPGSPGPKSTVPGPSGAPGVPGADSTVPGPQGIQGVPGVAGKDGKDGRDGAPGQPPAGWTWTWTDPAGTVHTYTCSPVEGFDPSSPRYQCGESPPTSPTPTPTPITPTSQPAISDRRRT